jgi:hypothetical protein
MGCCHSHSEAILQNGRGMYDLPLIHITSFPPKLHQALSRLLSTLPSAESLAPVATTPSASSTGTRAKLSPMDSATESPPQAFAFRTIMDSLCRCQVLPSFNICMLKCVMTTTYGGKKNWLHVNFCLYSWLLFTRLNPLPPTADGCIFVWSLQNPRQSKSSASIDVPRTSQPPAPVPRLLLEEPDASELPPPPISARAKQAEEQRALLYRMLGGKQDQPEAQQQQQQQQQQPLHTNLLLESAKLPVRPSSAKRITCLSHSVNASQTWAKRPHAGVGVSTDHEDDAGLRTISFILCFCTALSRCRSSLPRQPAAAAPRHFQRRQRRYTELLGDGS